MVFDEEFKQWSFSVIVCEYGISDFRMLNHIFHYTDKCMAIIFEIPRLTEPPPCSAVSGSVSLSRVTRR
jgi:hypothetical protein